MTVFQKRQRIYIGQCRRGGLGATAPAIRVGCPTPRRHHLNKRSCLRQVLLLLPTGCRKGEVNFAPLATFICPPLLPLVSTSLVSLVFELNCLGAHLFLWCCQSSSRPSETRGGKTLRHENFSRPENHARRKARFTHIRTSVGRRPENCDW